MSRRFICLATVGSVGAFLAGCSGTITSTPDSPGGQVDDGGSGAEGSGSSNGSDAGAPLVHDAGDLADLNATAEELDQGNVISLGGSSPDSGDCTGWISGLFWGDTNRDGCRESTETSAFGVSVTLIEGCEGNRVLGVASISRERGLYAFTNLCAGEYRVEFDIPEGFKETTSDTDCGDAHSSKSSDGVACVTLESDDERQSDVSSGIAEVCTGAIGDSVWLDENDNDCRDESEAGVSGITVLLFDGCDRDAPQNSTLTDSEGNYLFSGICSGEYRLEFEIPDGFSEVAQDVPCFSGADTELPSARDCFTLREDDRIDLSLDLGLKARCTGRFNDRVWLDTNKDGCQDPDEAGIEGVIVSLFSSHSDRDGLARTASDDTGRYEFSGLCDGAYRVEFEMPRGLAETLADAGCDDENSRDSDCRDGAADVEIIDRGRPILGMADCGFVAPGDEGCSQGYWKNHTGRWVLTGYAPDDLVDEVFKLPEAFSEIAGETLSEALRFSGGPDAVDKAALLLKQAVAALLNAGHPHVEFRWGVDELIELVDRALASEDPKTMLDLKDDLDTLNNKGCPLDGDADMDDDRDDDSDDDRDDDFDDDREDDRDLRDDDDDDDDD
ncbi:MAG: SdrD B-like domain-containing protein [Planctomycetota bacterium]|jgi:hypothetical protein